MSRALATLSNAFRPISRRPASTSFKDTKQPAATGYAKNVRNEEPRQASNQSAAPLAEPPKPHIPTPLEAYVDLLIQKHGRKFKVPQFQSIPLMMSIVKKIPEKDLVNNIALYMMIEGSDGSTTEEALSYAQEHFVGKYYMLQADRFQIQADRDYPREGRNTFFGFGGVRRVGDHYVFANVMCYQTRKFLRT